MRDAENIKAIAALNPDYMGFIFYEPSSRNSIGIDREIIRNLPDSIEPVGVFVDDSLQRIEEITSYYGIETVQLHGKESPDFCRKLKDKGYQVIKAMSVSTDTRVNFFNAIKIYLEAVDLFLFDTAGEKPGGNGIKFDWSLLENYNFSIPYLLSGGISIKDGYMIKNNLPPGCVGADINSKFELLPGLKDSVLVADFINKIKVKNESTE